MDISGTYTDNAGVTQTVRMVAVNGNGHNVYVSYVDGSGNLKSEKKFLDSPYAILLTSATIN